MSKKILNMLQCKMGAILSQNYLNLSGGKIFKY